jgi:hypothetical protein
MPQGHYDDGRRGLRCSGSYERLPLWFRVMKQINQTDYLQSAHTKKPRL